MAVEQQMYGMERGEGGQGRGERGGAALFRLPVHYWYLSHILTNLPEGPPACNELRGR